MRNILVTTTAAAAAVVLVGSTVAIAASDVTPDMPPRMAFVARGDGANFADALAIGSIAGQLGAPVLTTHRDFLTEDTAAALVDLAPELVIIAGGPNAVTAEVEAAIEEATGLADDKVVRVQGDDRYGTAAAMADVFEDLGINPAFLPADGKAATAGSADNAAMLDGMDSASFQPVGDYLTAEDQVRYLVEIDKGEEAVLATVGPLTFTGACSDSAGDTKAAVAATSSEGPWFMDSPGSSGSNATAAGVDVDVEDITSVSADYDYWYANVAVPGTGTFLPDDGYPHAIWVNLPGGSDCTFVGFFTPVMR